MIGRAALVAVLLVSARTAMADPTDAERYYSEGQTAYDAQHYDDAIVAWQRSYAASRLPALLYNLAQAHRLAGHCALAVSSYQDFIKSDPTSPQRADAESRLKEIQPCAAPDQPKPKQLPPVPPPPVKPPPPPIDKPVTTGGTHHTAGIVLAGAGVLLGVGGGVFGLQAQSSANDVKSACTAHCEWTPTLAADESAGQRDQTLQYVLYGAGAAAVIVGVLVYRSGHHEVPAVAIVPREGGAAVTWAGHW